MKSNLLPGVRQYAEGLLTRGGAYAYHNLLHTQEVAAAAREIGKKSGLAKTDMEVVLLAAWLHDAGFDGREPGHEAKSIALARAYLTEQGAAPDLIDRVTACIEATSLPQQPRALPGQVLCDADMAHLGRKGYLKKAAALRQEWQSLSGITTTDGEWLRLNLQFLQQHRYFTPYAQRVFAEGKERNIRKLQRRLGQKSLSPRTQALEAEVARLKEKLDEEKHKFGRGVETLFRTTSHNHLQLSAIADNKANIMITVNSIIVSLVVSVLMRKLEEFPNFIVPTVMLTISCLVTIVLAVLATRPSFTSGTFRQEDVEANNTNLLFFGNFHNMPAQAYAEGMKQIIADNERLYDSMIYDIHHLGRVLGRKYNLIRSCYTVFMIGIVASVVAYAVALVFFPVQE